MTVLPNGLKIVSEDIFSQTAHVGVMVDAGPVDETKLGTAHVLLKLLSGQGRTKQHSVEAIRQKYEEISGVPHANLQKESMSMSTDTFRDNVPTVVELLSASLQQPVFNEEDIEQAREVVELELDNLPNHPAFWLAEELNSVALSSPYSQPQIGLPPDDTPITPSDVAKFHSEFFTPSRLVVAAAGVEHSSFVSLVSKHWESMPAATELKAHPTATYTKVPVYLPISIEERVDQLNHRRIQKLNRLAKTHGDVGQHYHLTVEHEAPEHSHLSLGFQAPSIVDSDFHTLCVINTMLGGGTSFSAGGPGKGMYARLYLNALNRHEWIRACNAYFNPFRDLCIFGIYAECTHEQFYPMLEVVVREMLGLVHVLPNDEELTRAKNLIKSQIFAAIDQRAMLWDDMARQTVAYGQKIAIAEHVRVIEAITQQDIYRVAHKILSSPPVLVAHTYKATIANASKLEHHLSEHIKNNLPPQ